MRRYFIQKQHNKSSRNYIERVNNSKLKCIKVAKKYDFDYWDGDRKFGYGGYKYIKDYWKSFAKKLIKNYKLNNKSKIVDLGCGKGYLLFEIKKLLPDIKILGIDNSNYAIKNSKGEIKKFLLRRNLKNRLPYKNDYFDLAISLATFHNFDLETLEIAIKEMSRISKNQYLMVESFSNEKQRFNLQCWALTAETLISIKDWVWLFKNFKFKGDYEFIFFN